MNSVSSQSDFPQIANVTLAILAGGAGRRMGKPKAWLELDGEPVLARLHRTLAWPGPTLLVTVPERRAPPGVALFDREVVDPFEAGPLRGVLTALEHSVTPITIVIPVDMPSLKLPHLRWFIEQLVDDPRLLGVMARRQINGDEQVEPLPFCCRRAAADAIATQIGSGIRSLHAMLKHARFIAAIAPSDWTEDVWRNLNSPADL